MSCHIRCGPYASITVNKTLDGYSVALVKRQKESGITVTEVAEMTSDQALVLMGYFGVSRAIEMTRRIESPLDFNRMVTVTL